jgi:primary-amine oxidase
LISFNPDGTLYTVPDAVMIYERVNGALFYHDDFFGGLEETVQTIPNRELVIACLVTIGNYDYVFEYILRQDGRITTEIQLTGMMSFKGVSAQNAEQVNEKWDGRFNTFLESYLMTGNHQHFFSVKTTWDIARDQSTDEPAGNIVAKSKLVPLKLGPDNPWGNAWQEKEEEIEKENESPSDIDPQNGVSWVVEKHEHSEEGHSHRGYQISPDTGTVKRLMNSKSRLSRRAFFLDQSFVATVFNPEEKWALGDWPVGKDEDVGLSTYIHKKNASLHDQVITTRFLLTVGHKPHAEDWPLMPREETRVVYKPHGYFKQNPAMKAAREAVGGGFTDTL